MDRLFKVMVLGVMVLAVAGCGQKKPLQLSDAEIDKICQTEDITKLSPEVREAVGDKCLLRGSFHKSDNKGW